MSKTKVNIKGLRKRRKITLYISKNYIDFVENLIRYIDSEGKSLGEVVIESLLKEYGDKVFPSVKELVGVFKEYSEEKPFVKFPDKLKKKIASKIDKK